MAASEELQRKLELVVQTGCTLSGVTREKFANFPMPRNTAVFAPTFNGEGIVVIVCGPPVRYSRSLQSERVALAKFGMALQVSFRKRAHETET